MQRCRSGDAEALEQLFRLHVNDGVHLAFFVTRDWAAAEDAAQEAFVRAFRSIRKLRPGWPFAPWFHRIVLNEARRAARRAGRSAIPIDFGAEEWDLALGTVCGGGDGSGDADPEAAALREDARRRVWAAVLELPEPYRLPIILKYHRGLSEAGIAAILTIPAGRVKSRLYDARQKLKKVLDDEGGAAYDSHGTYRRQRPEHPASEP